MTRARSTISVSFLRGEARRQSVLDCLHLHPEGMTWPQLSAYLAAKTGDTKEIDGLLKSQIDLREIYYTGQRGKRVYLAIAKTTLSAAAMRQRHVDGCKLRGKEKPLGEARTTASGKPGHYVHKPSYTHNSGGQGALRDRVWVGSSCGMV